MDNTKWPAELNWVIPGTPEFTARYTAGDTAGGEPVIAGTGCTAAHGGDAYRYTLDFFTQLGSILDAQATATGHGVMTLGDRQLPTAPWPGLATDRGTAVLTLGSGEKVMATPGALIPMPSSGGALAGGAGVCADTLRAYGTPAADAPFGFGFYNAPDQGSVDFLMTQLAGQQDLPAAVPGESTWATRPSSTTRSTGAENALRTWDFSPLKFTDYCADENNPFCLTAAFLRCPAGDGGDRRRGRGDHGLPDLERERDHPEPGHRDDADDPGGGCPGRRGSRSRSTRSPAPGSRHRWTGGPRSRSAARPSLQAVKMLYVSLGAAALIGGLVAGGIPGLLIAAGVIGVAGLVARSGHLRGGVLRAGLPQMPGRRRRRRVGQNPGVDPGGRRVHAGPGHDRPVDDGAVVHPGRHLRRPGAGVLPDLPAGRGADAPARADLARVLRPDRVGRGDGPGRCVPDHAHHGPRRGDDLAEHRRRRRNRAGGFPGVGEGEPDRDRRGSRRPDCCWPVCCRSIGIVLGVVVWVIVWVSGQWIPLVVALLVLQSAGMAAPGMPRKWLSRGFSVLWTLLLTPVMVLIIWRVGKVGLESNTGYLGLLSGVLVLLACAFSFLIVQRMLPMGEGAGMGIGAAMMSAASWVAGRASSAGAAGSLPRTAGATATGTRGRPGRRRRAGRRQRRRVRRPGPARAARRNRRRSDGPAAPAAPRAAADNQGQHRGHPPVIRRPAAGRRRPGDPQPRSPGSTASRHV